MMPGITNYLNELSEAITKLTENEIKLTKMMETLIKPDGIKEENGTKQSSAKTGRKRANSDDRS